MTKLFRILILAVLAVVVMPLSSARSATVLACGNSQDCPFGRVCVTKPHHRLGQCVSEVTSKMQILCEGSIDCPFGKFCSTRSGQKIGHCVSNPSSGGGGPFSQAATVRTVNQCENSPDCSLGHHCKIKPGKTLGTCVAP
jgi:hypothetical protein